jgi:hydrogenase small subunit
VLNPLIRDRRLVDPPGPDRREFLRRACLLAAAAIGMPSDLAAHMVREVEAGRKPTVIWLSLQECTGCTETLLRTSKPRLDELLLDLINLEYHEALTAAAGHQAERSRVEAMERYAGQYILVTEGAIPTKDDGIYCMIGGRTAMDLLQETAQGAAAIVAYGSCASWGGLPSSAPNPTGAVGTSTILPDRTVVSIPGCPPNPYNLLGTLLQFATLGTLPELDDKGRPRWSYGRTVHEHCERRAHFDAGRFATRFGDEGHREGWCLYKLGCKGPQTFANCSVLHFNETPGAWPIGIGHPCYGCTESTMAFTQPIHATVDIDDRTPPTFLPSVTSERTAIDPLATGLAGAVLGGLLGAGWVSSRKLRDDLEAPGAQEG